VAAGEAGAVDFGVVRYNSNGSLDTSFDGDGKVTTDLSLNDVAYSAQIQPDGKIVVAGESESGQKFSIARYNTGGSLDQSFGSGGKVITDTPGSSGARSLVIQSDGRILAAGRDTNASPGFGFVFARYGNDGSLDTSFDVDGMAAVGGLGSLGGMTLDAQGRILAVGGNGSFSMNGTFTVARFRTVGHQLFDASGDGRADLSVYRASNNTIYTQSAAGYSFRQWGEAGDLLTPADYDGDGKADISVFRPSTGTWYFIMSATNSFSFTSFGQAGDLPVPADRDADGFADLTVYRPSTGAWMTRLSNSTTETGQFGVPGDKPLNGDFDGDGKSDRAVYQPSTHDWLIQGTSSGIRVMTWGVDGDVAVPADYDGDGKTDIAVWRPSTGQWYVVGSSAGWMFSTWGVLGDIPVPADYDGDGRSDVAVFRPSTGTWYVIMSTEGFFVRTFGQQGDIPVPSAYSY
jgi:uncharacterized delta-60 repeat protein